MFRARRSEDGGQVIFTLSGRIEEKHLPGLQDLIQSEANPARIILDLEEVKLVDAEAVEFLAACEARGIELKNSPSYVRKWIESCIDPRSSTRYE